MGAYLLRTTGTIETDDVGVADVQTFEFNDIAAADTFKLTHNAVETAGAVTYSADMVTDITAAIESLAAFAPGDVVVTKTDTNTYVATFAGAWAGKVVGAFTITSASGFTPTGVTATATGRSEKTVILNVGRFAQLYAVRWGLFVNGSTNELLITDAAGRTIYSVTGKDTNVSGALLRTHTGADGQDQSGNALANVGPTKVEGPLTVRVRNQAGTVTPASGSVELFVKGSSCGARIVKRSTGAIVTSGAGAVTVDMKMGSTFGRPFFIQIDGFDSSCDVAITDVNGANVFTDTGIDGTTGNGLETGLGYDGEDQAGNAAADSLPGVFRGPLTIAVTNGGVSTTGTISLWCEI